LLRNLELLANILNVWFLGKHFAEGESYIWFLNMLKE